MSRVPAREDLTHKILDEKRSRGLTWKEIAVAIGPGSAILYTAALLGQMTLTKDEAGNAAKLLHLSEDGSSATHRAALSRFARNSATHGPADLSLL
jgi:cyanate lyase